MVNRDQFVYPGQALVIAVRIMEKYPNMQEANKPAYDREGKPHHFPEALGDSDIPGAGGCVYSALRILRMDDVDASVVNAYDQWEGECTSGYKDRYNEGVEGIKALESRYRELRATWDNKYVRVRDDE